MSESRSARCTVRPSIPAIDLVRGAGQRRGARLGGLHDPDGAVHLHHDEPELLEGAPRGRDPRGEHGPEEGLAEQTGRRILDGGALAYGHHPDPSAAGEANEGRPSTICRM